MRPYWKEHRDVTLKSFARYVVSSIKLQKEINRASNNSRNALYEQQKTRASTRRSETSPIMSTKECWGCNYTSSLSKKSSSLKYCSLKQTSRRPDKVSRQLATVYQQTPPQTVVQQDCLRYYCELKYWGISVCQDTMEEHWLITTEVRTIVKQQRKESIEKQWVNKFRVPSGMDGKSITDKNRMTSTGHYHIEISLPSMTKNTVSNSASESFQRRWSQLSCIVRHCGWPRPMIDHECIIRRMSQRQTQNWSIQ